MYQIIDINTNELIGIVTEPNYIRLKKETGIFISAKKIEQAEGIAFRNTVYNWVGHGDNLPVEHDVILMECDAGEFAEKIPVIQNSISSIEDVLCEIDMLNLSESIAAIEDALCEMDINNVAIETE